MSGKCGLSGGRMGRSLRTRRTSWKRISRGALLAAPMRAWPAEWSGMAEELEGRLRERRNVLFLEVAICALLAVAALLEQIPDNGSFRLWFVAGMALVCGDAAWTAFRALPRLQRERNELG